MKTDDDEWINADKMENFMFQYDPKEVVTIQITYNSRIIIWDANSNTKTLLMLLTAQEVVWCGNF